MQKDVKNMANSLVIVESPAKVKTIKKFLGSTYEVDASNGHVRDLPKSQLGIDVENDYEPKYITIRGKGDILAKLRKEVKKADKIYLATDPDREGEAISWHLMKALKLDEVKDKKVYRISFNEITKNAVKASLKAPRDIDMNLVDAQQTRRILDRIVGYKISPILWEKVKRGLSAGRVQSAALRMICDREEEISAFIPEEYWSLDAMLKAPGSKKPAAAHFHNDKDGKTEIKSKAELDALLESLKGQKFIVTDIRNGERTKKPPLPFTTSTLQQEASKALNFSTQKTMRLAQQLYEGVDVKGHGTVGLITYLRTDSTRVAEEAEKMASDFINKVKAKYPDSLFIFVGDHADRYNIDKVPTMYERYSVPLIITGKGIQKDLLPEDMAGSQIDIMPTVIDLIAPEGFTYYSVGKSLSENKLGQSYAFWITADAIGNTDDLVEKPQYFNREVLPDRTVLENYINGVRAISWWLGKYGTIIDEALLQ